MSSRLTFTWEQAKQVADEAVLAYFGEPLKDIQLNVLQDTWEGLTYTQIAQKHYLSVNYLRGDIGPKLWQKLSTALGQEVTKTNFKAVLQQFSQSQALIEEGSALIESGSIALSDFPFPEGSVPPDSLFYQDRRLEPFCYQVISQPGALLQVRSPQLMGKTSFLKKILYQANLEAYQTLYLDLWQVEKEILENPHRFLQWFCLILAKKLNLESCFNAHWDTLILSSSDHCTLFFEDYLLPSLEQPLVLALDDLDQVFGQIDVAQNFLRMIRSWHEKGKSSASWQKLRLIVAYSSEHLIWGNIHSLFFNLGIVVELDDFQKPQIEKLAMMYELNFSDEQINALILMFGGNPYLIRLALYQIKFYAFTCEDFLKYSPTLQGCYANYLDQKALSLQTSAELIRAFKNIVDAEKPISLNPILVQQLDNLGLVRRQGNQVTARCQLYALYFKNFAYGQLNRQPK